MVTASVVYICDKMMKRVAENIEKELKGSVME